MSLLLLCPTKDPQPWKAAIAGLDPSIEVCVWPEVAKPEDITFALVWNHPPAVLDRFKNLKAISSLGAGIDHINNDPGFPSHLPLTRIVDPALVQSMSEYVVTAVMQHFRGFTTYATQQAGRVWKDLPPNRISDCRLGVMGMGVLGSDAATKLHALGFSVDGWSRQRKTMSELSQSFAGQDELPAFLHRANILICLLPLTSSTEGILNQNLFAQLPKDAYLINAARGHHLVEKDLLEAINSGKMSGACLDVFREEPLPAIHPFWQHPKITITPHIASLTDPRSAAHQVVENYHRANEGRPLLNAVDLTREY
ncbi:MAG: 2-hydroxyacid dehydrogenase [Rhodothermales bacterium]